jgi:hypothetical protein
MTELNMHVCLIKIHALATMNGIIIAIVIVIVIDSLYRLHKTRRKP